MTTWGARSTYGSWSTWGGGVGVTWGDLTLWGDLTVWFDPDSYPAMPSFGVISLRDGLPYSTITPLERAASSVRPLRLMPAGINISPSPGSESPSAITIAPESLAPAPPRLMAITAVTPTITGVIVTVTPATELPTTGLPVFYGTGDPGYSGAYLVIIPGDPVGLEYDDGS